MGRKKGPIAGNNSHTKKAEDIHNRYFKYFYLQKKVSTKRATKHAQIKDQLIDEFLIELISDSNFSDEFKLAFIVQLSVAARSIEILGGRVNSSSLTEFRGVRKSNFRYDQEKNLLFVDDIEVAKKRNKIDCREGAIRPVAAKWVREQLLKLGPDEKIYRKSKVAYFKQFKRIHPKLSSHSLRHTSISEMINRGIDSVAISKYMAWSQASTAMSYSHINVRSFVENLYSDKKVA
ncbi:MAG: tyrosine-type recombinase/integrase [Bdellovibrionaceae bacterium]|nr:tyrosine-type recombinase/integrase [Pseudobdellovibrionaceae bacterium]MCB9092922.1 tyrosine-type recombinase/integrase [Halobacteriovoraceae bacterium]